ncbi:hypothetical protein M9H77_24503 [Catharanthus roseus]|uniref:Uncharacterized protein n=1 Tax=Catharanthus roseus TaxID=4058 RepID=A0ACC0AY09_CATRO|nr:hypothetical protein M9H77_24503 [Catharanthus roseus]
MGRTLLLLSILLFLIHSSISAPEPVLDTAGKKVRIATNYYILPATPGANGGIMVASTGNKTCPMDVVKAENGLGYPFRFYPANYKKGVIRVSTDQNIVTDTYSSCYQPKVWKLDQYDPSTGKYFITTAYEEGNPGLRTIKNWFKIEKYGTGGYKFMYCPSVCSDCKVMCKDVGLFVKDGQTHLALAEEPFEVVFQPWVVPS